MNFISTFCTSEYQNLLHLTDAKLHTDDGDTFDVHRVILAKENQYFMAMFSRYNSNRSEFWIPDISGEILSGIVTYLYTGKYNVTERNLTDTMIAADYLLVDGLSQLINDNFKDKITISNCLPIFIYASLINNTDICETAFRFIEMHFESIVCNDEITLAELSLDSLKLIISSKNLNTSNEISVWLTVVKWIQKDLMKRQCYVLYLLKLLAWKDIDEDLAMDILKHQIVTDNIYCSILDKYRNISNSNLDIFRQYNLRCKQKLHIDSFGYRNPPRLHVIAKRLIQHGNGINCQLFVTYKDNLDLWRKIQEISFYPDTMISIKHNIFLLNFSSKRWFSINLKENNLRELRNVWRCLFAICAINIEQSIYIIGNANNPLASNPLTTSVYGVEVYDSQTNAWMNRRPIILPYINVRNIHAAAISGRIYFVGTFTGVLTILAYAYDTVSQTTSPLPSSPTIPFPMLHRYIRIFAFIAHRKKLYIVLGLPQTRRTVNMFDTITNTWIAIPYLPFEFATCAMILKDHLYVCDENDEDESSTRVAHWNHGQYCWEELDGPNLEIYMCCPLEDMETVRSVSKGNIYINIELEKCDLCFAEQI